MNIDLEDRIVGLVAQSRWLYRMSRCGFTQRSKSVITCSTRDVMVKFLVREESKTLLVASWRVADSAILAAWYKKREREED